MKGTKVEFVTDSQIFAPKDVSKVLKQSLSDGNLRGTNRGIYYYNVPCAFDIETTSFYRYGNVQYTYDDVKLALKANPKSKFEKCAIMYVWQLGINGRVIIGRTWNEFVNVCKCIVETLHLNKNKRLIIYVHNLSYEFQFMRCYFRWDNVFSIDERKPIKATTTDFIEFRCSYLLTGYSLSKLGEQLQKYKVAKMVGDLDYSKIRHSQTPLTEKEIEYCVNDVRVVMACVQEKIENEKGITNIPLTKTGYVRRHSRAGCLYVRDNNKRRTNFKYRELMGNLQLSGLNEFAMLHRAFQGGFTHGNANHIGEICNNVASFDFTSSYPYVMVTEQYPMSHGMLVHPKNEKDFRYYIDNFCCIFDIMFYNIFNYETQDAPLSVSKCYRTKNVVENNGRVFAAAEITTTITNIDYKIISVFYRWSKKAVGEMYVYRRGYLPTEFVKTILELYQNKTTLKGVKGKEIEYLKSKEMINSCYGMTVTNPLRDEIIYDTKWDVQHTSKEQMEEMLYQYNIARNRFLFYPWGVFVTAYARRNLFTAIYNLKDDYIYADTDSVKVLNYETHKSYFDKYNDIVRRKLETICAFHGIPFSMVEPKTIKGVTKRLGVWDFEGVYEHFKTLGAKRYMVHGKNVLTVGGINYDYSLTVSGLDKRAAIPYLWAKYGDNMLDVFTDNLYIPPQGTGKNLHTYVDYEIEGAITDFNGVKCSFKEKSGVHLEPTDYTLNLSVLFMDFIQGKRFKI